MYSFIDNLVFPAPSPSYSAENFPSGKLLFIPKFNDFNRLQAQWRDDRHNEEKAGR